MPESEPGREVGRMFATLVDVRDRKISDVGIGKIF